MENETKSETIIISVFDDVDPTDSALPEKSLLLAVLMSAFHDLQKDGSLSAEALEYLLSRDEQYLFSFRSVCHCLEIDPEKLLKLSGLSS